MSLPEPVELFFSEAFGLGRILIPVCFAEAPLAAVPESEPLAFISPGSEDDFCCACGCSVFTSTGSAAFDEDVFGSASAVVFVFTEVVSGFESVAFLPAGIDASLLDGTAAFVFDGALSCVFSGVAGRGLDSAFFACGIWISVFAAGAVLLGF